VKTAVNVVIFEKFQLSLEVNRIPEQRLIKKLTTNDSDESINYKDAIGAYRVITLQPSTSAEPADPTNQSSA
jgi:hypothetical protein